MAHFTGKTHIVVPLDGNDRSLRAVPIAGRLAERLGLQVRLFRSVNEAIDVETATRWLNEVRADHLSTHKVSEIVVVADDPAQAIVNAIGRDGLACMATGASTGFHQGHFGSIAEGVARRLGEPLILIGPEADIHPGDATQKIVAPVDGSELSEAVLPVAIELAQVLDVPLWIVSVISPKAEAEVARTLGNEALISESSYVHNVARHIEERHEVDVQFEVLHSDHTADAIVDFTGADGTAVMSTHGRSGLSRLFAGSVTTGVVAKSKRAVVVIHPPEE